MQKIVADTTRGPGSARLGEGLSQARVPARRVAATLAALSGYRLDILRIQKLAWLAEISHRRHLGRPLIDDVFVATDFGPMPLGLADFWSGLRPLPARRFWNAPALRAEHPQEGPSHALLARLVDQARAIRPGALVAATHRSAWSTCYIPRARVLISEDLIDQEAR